YSAKVEEYGPELMREVERYLVLQVVDVRWREHLESMEYLRDGIHLRAMAQKDPLSEYRAEGHAMFEELTAIIQEEVVRYLLRLQIEKPPEEGELEPAASASNGDGLTYEHESAAGSEAIRAAGANEAALQRARAGSGAGATAGAAGGAATTVSTGGQRVVAEADRVGRNDPCPCGSGKKYKKCHGA
ncbi:MAG: SEC-C metal-binding domain-containing protein, partial [Gaiellaceae bacterium]